LNSYTSDRYKEAHGIIVVYDVTNQASFDHIPSFLDEIARHETTTGLGKPSILLVGCKTDLSPRVVTTEAAEVHRHEQTLLCIQRAGFRFQPYLMLIASLLPLFAVNRG
jgi:GTPase SAR1 family protein